MRGRKPTSTATKRLTGNPGKRRINAQEPQPPPLPEVVPEELIGLEDAIAEWRRLSPMLRRARQITDADRAALIALCLEWSRYLDATRQLKTKGLVVEAPSGYLMANPLIAIATKALHGCNRLWPELGLTPSSRSRVKMDGPGVGGDEFSEFDHPLERVQ